MTRPDKLRILFAINPVSGGTDKAELEATIQTYFANSPYHARLFHLDGKRDTALIQQQIADYKPDRVVAVGGDGTIKLVAEQLLHSDMTLGILPAGSANGMAKELGLPESLTDCLNVIMNGKAKPIDVILVNNTELCLHLSDVGLNAQLVKHYHENNWRGKIGYLRAVLRTLEERKLLRLALETATGHHVRAAYMVVLANARMYGTGAVINPDGDLSDGLFEVIILRTLSFWEILKMFWQYQPFDKRRIEVLQVKQITIRTKKRVYFQIDGEYRGRIREVKARIDPGALQIMVP
jgi:diacylglycerol kinase (ATP)